MSLSEITLYQTAAERLYTSFTYSLFLLFFFPQGFSGEVVGGMVQLPDGQLVLALGTGLLVKRGDQDRIITGHTLVFNF